MLFNIDNAPSYVNKYSANIKPITVADINKCIRKYFRRENMVVSVIGRSPPSQKMLEKYVDSK
jgi:predicted Zn-dependent peptidase